MSVPSLLSIFGNSGGEDKVYVDDVFSTHLWAGNSGALTINNGIDLDGEGGLVWLKQRSGPSEGHTLIDTVRGQTKVMFTNYNSYGNFTSGATQDLTSFNSNGFSLGPNFNYVKNSTGATNVSWTFRKAPGFFDIVTWSGNDTARAIPHNLGSVPGMIIVKKTSDSGGWYVYHRSMGNGAWVDLSSANDASTVNFWNNQSPTASNFYLSTNVNINGSGQSFIAYVFAHDDAVFGTDEDESIIHCGSFTGSASPFSVDIGFEPSWILFKDADANGRDWMLWDEMRPNALVPNSSDDETSSFTSNIIFEPRGFRILQQNNHNIAGETTIFMAIRRPNKPPEDATKVFAVDTGNSSSTIPAFDSGFPVDFSILKEYNTGDNDNFTFSRLTGQRVLRTNTNVAEVNGGGLWIADSMVGWSKQYNNTNISYMFKRAPGFFDQLAYNGTSSAATINHNLGISPEIIIIKCREGSNNGGAGGWHVLVTSVNKEFLYLSTNGSGINPTFINTPTATTFGVISHPNVNYQGQTYISLLFGTLSGVSKVGSYSGTGNAINVDCGFTNGARFVMIKRANGTGDWYVWDSVRGIVSGNDPYILLNENATQVTGTDYIDPLSAGFTVTSSAPDALNVSGGTYLFLAIA